MSDLDTIKAIQKLLGVDDDGKFGPKSLSALNDLIKRSQKPVESSYPIPVSEYSKTFSDFIPWILDAEGRYYENDPNDPGGATKYGIDSRSHPGIDVRNLTETQAIDIYWKEWLLDGCDKLKSPYAEVFFNCAVNMGLGRAEQFDSIAKGDPNRFLISQENKYRDIVRANSKMGKYLDGWLNRNNAIRKRFSI